MLAIAPGDLFCPTCGSDLAQARGTVATMHEHPKYGKRVEYAIEHFLYCTHCPLATSVDQRSGQCVNINCHINELSFPPDVRTIRHEATS